MGEETFSAYHTHCKPNALPSTRQLCYDRSGYHADGTAYICGPSLGWQLLPLADLGRQNLAPLADAPAALTDGDTCVSASSRPYAWQGTQADFVWASPAEAELIQIYPAGYLGKGTLLVNGCYEAQLDFSACRDVPGGSIILPLAQPWPFPACAFRWRRKERWARWWCSAPNRERRRIKADESHAD